MFTAMDVEAGTASPDDARKLMRYFCDFHESGDIPPKLLLHFRNCFDTILRNEISTEQALGLKRKQKPHADETEAIGTVTTCLKLRLAGKNWDDAAFETAEKHYVSKSTVEQRWKKHRGAALMAIQVERGKDYVWTTSERKILESIFH